jgi:hypothetical protein
LRPAGCAARRLRGALKSFRKVLGLPAATRLRAELAWPGDALGEARDNEVLASRLSDLDQTLSGPLPGANVSSPATGLVSGLAAVPWARPGRR